jgi:hypothetical protein
LLGHGKTGERAASPLPDRSRATAATCGAWLLGERRGTATRWRKRASDADQTRLRKWRNRLALPDDAQSNAFERNRMVKRCSESDTERARVAVRTGVQTGRHR